MNLFSMLLCEDEFGGEKVKTMNIRLFTLPNMLTLANLVAGSVAVVAALQWHDYTLSLWLIVAAAVCDFFDGFVARLLKQQSPLGVQLDSLADDISFGLAPALVMFDSYLGAESLYGMPASLSDSLSYVVLIIAAFSALRLAKFNIDDTQTTEFVGLPTPANALMLMSLAVLAQQGEVVLYREHILVIAIAASLLLVSPIRMFALKFKGFGFKGNELRYGFILLSAAIIICLPTYSVLVIIVLYIALSTLRWLFMRRDRGEA